MKLGLMPGFPATCCLHCVWSYKQDEVRDHSRDLVSKVRVGEAKMTQEKSTVAEHQMGHSPIRV